MDIFERFNSKFGKWYEGLFGSDGGELRPKDVLRKIIAAMEDNRKEGFDSKIYVPNKYILELAVADPEEREYLLSFLDEEELVVVLQKFMAQNSYKTRGPLDFTIAEVPEDEREARQEKLRVKVRFEKGEKEAALIPNSGGANSGGAGKEGSANKEGRAGKEERAGASPAPTEDLPTVAGISFQSEDDDSTVPAVAWASLALTGPDGRKSLFSLTKPVVQIGRSRNGANDLILDTDGMVSKGHARLERERDGSWTLYDLGSTNGVRVNGSRIDGNRIVRDGNEIGIGETILLFRQAEVLQPELPSDESAVPHAFVMPVRRASLIGSDGEVHVLASETLIGRAVTSDIVLSDPSVATKHARIIAPSGTACTLEDLGSDNGTRVNDRLLPTGRRQPLSEGDVLLFGSYEMHFSAGSV